MAFSTIILLAGESGGRLLEVAERRVTIVASSRRGNDNTACSKTCGVILKRLIISTATEPFCEDNTNNRWTGSTAGFLSSAAK